jgi:hypothetical protein
VPYPFSPGVLMYRSGDLAVRRGADLHFLGRKDQQVKVRGFRVELGEVEAVILKHPDVQEVVVGLRGSGVDQRLLAWIVARPGAEPGPAEIREHCAQLLPSYMVPASFVLLAALPLGTTGKIERSGLPVPDISQNSSRAPQTPLEISVAKTVAEVLGASAVGADDDFFALGGHSLAATRAVLWLSAEHGLPLTVQMLFERPTVAGLARTLELLRWAAVPAAAGPDGAAQREVGEL